MFEYRKDARKRLKTATLAEYNDLVHKAHLTLEQTKILDLHITHERSISNIAVELFCCEATVRKRLAEVYDKIAKV